MIWAPQSDHIFAVIVTSDDCDLGVARKLPNPDLFAQDFEIRVQLRLAFEGHLGELDSIDELHLAQREAQQFPARDDHFRSAFLDRVDSRGSGVSVREGPNPLGGGVTSVPGRMARRAIDLGERGCEEREEQNPQLEFCEHEAQSYPRVSVSSKFKII